MLDSVVRHKILVEQVTNGMVRQLLGPLKSVLDDAIERLEALESIPERARLGQLVAEITGDLVQAYRALGEALPGELLALAKVESVFQGNLLSRALGVPVPEIAEQALAVLVGKSWRDSLTFQRNDTTNALKISTRLALTEGEGAEGIVQRFQPAADLAQSAAEGMTREAIAETTIGVDLAVLDFAAGELGPAWLSVLDSDTCFLCASRDTLLLSELDGEIPPAHRWCRCVIVPVERGVARAEYERDSPSGPVHVRTYETWLRRQSAAFQKDALGPSRYTLFKKGRLPLRSFVDDGRELNLAELRQRHETMFQELFGG